ncbi:hypothetical protein B0H21DRAFT_536607 [Amylocystis lapponica]|nr:hypothetical protein B0H21DRAFT_536607 [Amylocystis lapponica]
MSPTCTLPYEVLFEFVNNTSEPTTMQVLRQDSGSPSGATILVHRGENVSLVLTAGQPYKYAMKHKGVEARVSVKLWNDTHCNISDIFPTASSPARTPVRNDEPYVVVTEGVAVTSFANGRMAASR